MKIALITGSGGLVGVESVKFLSGLFDLIIGIDNDSRGYFFGEGGSVARNISHLKQEYKNYRHFPIDIRDKERISKVFSEYNSDICLIINAAAQPSHDWSGRNPVEDFEINALAPVLLLDNTRKFCPKAVFIQLSSSKIYGDSMNSDHFQEYEHRYDFTKNDRYYDGFDESLKLDNSLHSPYGASKLSSDIMAQEYARYYGINVGIFRPNCITGGPHSGVELHGFLSYLVKCRTTYNVFGYSGKQVRDNIHALDLVRAFYMFYLNPKAGEAFNLGGGRANSCSILEAIELVTLVTGRELKYTILDKPRRGDHIWWITDNSKFKSLYPEWEISYSLKDIVLEIHNGNK